MIMKITIRDLSASAATLFFSITASLAVSAQTPWDMKMTEAQCSTLWTQARASSSGELSRKKAEPYVNDFKKADRDGDNELSQTEWIAACEQGLIRSSLDGVGDGTSGASEKTSDRTPDDTSPSRAPGATSTGAAGTEAAKTSGGTSDRTPTNH